MPKVWLGLIPVNKNKFLEDMLCLQFITQKFFVINENAGNCKGRSVSFVGLALPSGYE